MKYYMDTGGRELYYHISTLEAAEDLALMKKNN